MAQNKESVVLVDSSGQELLNSTGAVRTMDKMEAHRKGALHRAVSVFVFNEAGELLLQQRAFTKYHSPGKWSNACCTHPRLNETPLKAAGRRLKEEMGLECSLTEVLTFMYKADVGGGLAENEFDHVFISRCDQIPQPDPEEVCDWKWASPELVQKDIQNNPDSYTVWFCFLFPAIQKYLSKQ
jgi:isopentenyl-diphosphate delta-isomerase